MKQPENLTSLIELLDDPDESIYGHVREQLLLIGADVIPTLESAWESNLFGMLFQKRIEELIHEIQFSLVKTSLTEWAANESNTLLDGVLIVNRYQYPDFDQEETLGLLEQIQKDIWLELNVNLTAFEQVKVMNHILFELHGFTGNTRDFHSPKNSFLSEVLQSRRGNPLSLSLIYAIIAQNLDIPIYGINLPRHFVLGYLDRFSLYKTNSIYKADALFFINPFSKGAVFSHGEIDQFLSQLKMDKKESYYKAATNVAIVKRILNNLEYSYEQLGNAPKVEEIQELKSVLSDTTESD